MIATYRVLSALLSYPTEEMCAAVPAMRQALADDGLLTFTRVGFQATARGRLLLRVIAMCFDRYLPATPAPDAPRFSRTV